MLASLITHKSLPCLAIVAGSLVHAIITLNSCALPAQGFVVYVTKVEKRQLVACDGVGRLRIEHRAQELLMNSEKQS